MSATTDNRTLKDKIIELIDDNSEFELMGDGGIDVLNKTKAANAIEEIFLEEIGKGFDAGAEIVFLETNNKFDISEEKTQYLNSITQVKK